MQSLNLWQADAIRIKVGFPLSPDTRRAASIARYYGLVEIDEGTFFDNMLHATSVLGSHCRGLHRSFATGRSINLGPG